MARIVYGVAGEGFGHSSRSHLIGEHLLAAGHDVMFAGSRKSLSYLSQYFGERVKPVHGLRLVYDEGKLSSWKTFTQNVREYVKGRSVNRDLYKQHIEPFKPDLVITDYEPFTAWWAARNKVPCVSIDHQNTLTQLALDPIAKSFLPKLNANMVTWGYYIGTKHHVIINFFDAPVKSETSVLAPPVVRPHVAQRQSTPGEHILIYSTDQSTKERILRVCRNFPDRIFYIYGYPEEGVVDNCTFKAISTEGFLDDFASCKAVVATAGFSLISEALHFRKKMFLLPLMGQFEQMLNAHYVQKLGLGIWADSIEAESMARFFEVLDQEPAHGDAILWPDNERLFSILDEKLGSMLGQV